jgi:hypothetical protein
MFAELPPAKAQKTPPESCKSAGETCHLSLFSCAGFSGTHPLAK